MGPVGRFVVLVLIVFQLASAGATYPIQTTPDLFQTVHSWLPFTFRRRLPVPGCAAHRSLAGRWPLGVWLLAALTVTPVAAWRVQRRAEDTGTGADRPPRGGFGWADRVDPDADPAETPLREYAGIV
ncbi:hypothetical protein [Microbacterium deminutum]|uniref:Uncharacterized protein n=1 Tax=Microbacterium deminutum TaxID=344164 RepID=A0ABP5BLV3_9MICO